jgi:hypothetical protein
MTTEWFNYKDIPFKKMWLDDEYWFPYLFANKKFMGYVEFNQNHKTIVQQKYIENDVLEKFDFNKLDVL